MYSSTQYARRFALTAMTFAATLLGVTYPIVAGPGKGKGGKEDTVDAGVIYFGQFGELNSVLLMTADGNVVGAHPLIDPRPSAEPSWHLHAGQTWFLQVLPVPGTYPSGRARVELFAVSGDGSATVQLTDSSTREVIPDNLGAVRWARDDSFVAFRARDYASDGAVTQGGIYGAIVSFDEAGAVIGADSPTLLVNTGLWDADTESDPTDDEPQLYGFDLSPDEKIVWSGDGADHGTLRLTDMITWVTQDVADNGHSPSFSSDGSMIAFVEDNQHIAVIDSDGTNRTRLVTVSETRRTSRNGRSPFFSPAGNQLVYQIIEYKRQTDTVTSDIYRVNIDGSNNQNLTADVDDGVRPVGWRD